MVSHRYRPEGKIEKARKGSSEDDAGISGFLSRGFSIFRGINPSGHEETSEMAKRGPVPGRTRRGRANSIFVTFPLRNRTWQESDTFV